MSSDRAPLRKVRRVVVKIGSRALAHDTETLERLAEDVVDLSGPKRSFVMVSSGAIALGCKRLGFRGRPKDMGSLQAAASVGQTALMRRYDEAFSKKNRVAAQVLLTHTDLADRERLNNARNALRALLDAGAIPVINENDAVATDEICFGDNDQLAAMVTPLVDADLLLLLTDVSGVLDSQGRRIATMKSDTKIGTRKTSKLGSGGIKSKIDAAEKARESGAAVVIASGMDAGVLAAILQGEDVGTLFSPLGSRIRARKHWIAYTLRPQGGILVDLGAASALRTGKASLLPIGVLGIQGQICRWRLDPSAKLRGPRVGPRPCPTELARSGACSRKERASTRTYPRPASRRARHRA